jgi:hypothetical protein
MGADPDGDGRRTANWGPWTPAGRLIQTRAARGPIAVMQLFVRVVETGSSSKAAKTAGVASR